MPRGFPLQTKEEAEVAHDYLNAQEHGRDMTWDEFERHLISAGWTAEDAKRERGAQEHGDLGDCDGDFEP
jgi:hypothetical protein